MAEGKWITGLTAHTPVDEAASAVLVARLGAVRDALPACLNALNPDPEPIHQLRVGARRAGVALDLFRICLPHKLQRKVSRALRDIRRSAGQARDWDVFLLTLREKATRRDGVSFLRGYGHGQRIMAQDALAAAAEKFSADLSERWDDIFDHLAAPHGRGPAALLDVARETLDEQLRALDEATAEPPEDLAHLHQVRIIGKRLRYSMEIFTDCFAPAFCDDLYPRVEEMQDILGTLNDSRVATENLARLGHRLRVVCPETWGTARSEITYWSRFHQRQLHRQQQRFGAWLQSWQDSDAESEFRTVMAAALSTPG